MGQYFSFQNDARSIGLAGTGAVLSGPWSCFSNPAGISGTGNVTAAIGYRNYYEIPELGTGAFTVAVPLKPGSFSVSFASSGFGVFRQNHASSGFAMNLGKKARGGICIHWLHADQPGDYPSLYSFIPSAGIQLLPIKNLVAGIVVFNPARQQFRPEGYMKIPSIVTAGLGYQFGKETLFCLEMHNKSGKKPDYSCGVEITFTEKILIRLGLSLYKNPSYSAGMGFQLKHLVMNIAVLHHSVLGFSPSLDLSYSL